MVCNSNNIFQTVDKKSPYRATDLLCSLPNQITCTEISGNLAGSESKNTKQLDIHPLVAWIDKRNGPEYFSSQSQTCALLAGFMHSALRYGSGLRQRSG